MNVTPSFDSRVDPPICSVADAAVKVTALLELRVDATEPRPLDLAVAVVGSNALARRALDAVGDARRWTPKGLRESSTEPTQTFATLYRALEGAADSGVERLLVLITRPTIAAPDVLPSLEQVAERGIAIDFVAAGPDVDPGPFLRLVTRVGGEVVRPGDLRGHIDGLRRSACRQTEMRLVLATAVEPQRLFRVAPRPRAVDAVRFDEETRTLAWDAGALPPGADLVHAIEMSVPRRRVGVHRLAEAGVYNGEERVATCDVTIRCSVDPSEAAFVEPSVVRARERAEAAWLVEEVSRAFRNGDGRVVSMILDRLVRYFSAAGRGDTADQLWRARISFLRTGLVGLPTMNWLRRVVDVTEEAEA